MKECRKEWQYQKVRGEGTLEHHALKAIWGYDVRFRTLES
jgi:hypothetical protein